MQQTGKLSINEEYLKDRIAQMEQIVLKAQGAIEIMQAQIMDLRTSQGSANGKEQTEEKKAGPQPGRTEGEYANGSSCRTGDCD